MSILKAVLILAVLAGITNATETAPDPATVQARETIARLILRLASTTEEAQRSYLRSQIQAHKDILTLTGIRG